MAVSSFVAEEPAAGAAAEPITNPIGCLQLSGFAHMFLIEGIAEINQAKIDY